MKYVFKLSRIYKWNSIVYNCLKYRYFFDFVLPIVLDDSFSVFKYSSFSRRHDFYKNIWQTAVVDDSFHCKEEKDNEYDKHVVAIIDPTFQKGNRLSVLSFENENCNISFSIYYVPKFETKGYNVLIDGKSF